MTIVVGEMEITDIDPGGGGFAPVPLVGNTAGSEQALQGCSKEFCATVEGQSVPYRIVPADTSHLPGMLSLIDETVIHPFTKQPLPEIAKKLKRDVMTAVPANNEHGYHVAVATTSEGEVVVGMVGYVLPYIDEAVASLVTGQNSVEFHNTYVKPEYRRNGIALNIVAQALSALSHRNLDVIVARSGAAFKLSGWRAWDRLASVFGGNRVAIIQNYYGEPNLERDVIPWSEDPRPEANDAMVWVFPIPRLG